MTLDVSPTNPSLQASLRSAGLRVTASRLGVLGAVAHSTDHPDVDAIVERARERLGTVSVQAVYDVLGVLVRTGLVRRIEPAGNPGRYEARVGDNHHHVVCRDCGSVVDVDCVEGEAPCLEAGETHGYALDEAEITFWGRCPTCIARVT